MTRNPEEIQRDINRTREALAGTLDQLVERANPKRVVEDSKRSIKTFLSSPKGKALIGIASGVVVLLIARRINLARKTEHIMPQTVVFTR